MYEQTRRAQHRWDAMEPPDQSLSGAQGRRLSELAATLAPDFDSYQDFAQAVADELGTALDVSDDPRVLAAWQDAHPDPGEDMPTDLVPYGTVFATRASWGVATLRAALVASPAEQRWLLTYACELLAGVYGD